MIKQKHHNIYELQGASLTAAKTLLRELVIHYNKTKSPTTHNDVVTRLQSENSDILSETGLNEKNIQIWTANNTFPRAYANRPEIFLSPHRDPKFFMYSPIDYKGNAFVPTDGVLQNEQEEERVGNLLFAGGWSDPFCIIPAQRYGVAIPNDFHKHNTNTLHGLFHNASGKMNVTCFEAKGESLNALNAFLVARAKYTANPSSETEPKLADFPALGTPVPLIHEFGGRNFLVYIDTVPTQKPRGASPISMAEYVWVRSDSEDKMIGITPPPPPAELVHVVNPTKNKPSTPRIEP